VHQIALDLLEGGLNAGTFYPQVWIRNLKTFIIDVPGAFCTRE